MMIMCYNFRKEALLLWKQKLGDNATYNNLISTFEHAGYQNYADFTRTLIASEEKYYQSDDLEEGYELSLSSTQECRPSIVPRVVVHQRGMC